MPLKIPDFVRIVLLVAALALAGHAPAALAQDRPTVANDDSSRTISGPLLTRARVTEPTRDSVRALAQRKDIPVIPTGAIARIDKQPCP